jgi:hypothetical protein
MNTTLQNLYINKEFYSKDYNYYNYFKFKQTGIIPIYYKTPSIFLDGLYFKVPDCQVLKIEKKSFDTDFILTIKLQKDDFIPISKISNLNDNDKINKLIQILKNLDKDNIYFFEKNYKFFPLKRKRTNKSIYIKKDDVYQQEKQKIKDNIELNWDGTPNNYNNNLNHNLNHNMIISDSATSNKEIPNLDKDSNNGIYSNETYKTTRFHKPEQYASYASFLREDDSGSIIMKVIIKHNYFSKLLHHIINKNLIPDGDGNKLNNIITFCQQDFYILKKKSYYFNCDNIDIKIPLCLKSNIFYLDGKNIKMKWNICDFY